MRTDNDEIEDYDYSDTRPFVKNEGLCGWLIDMARASESALSECVPKEKLRTASLPFLAQLKELKQ